MHPIVDYPLLVAVLTYLVMWLSARIGLVLRNRRRKLEEAAHQDLDLIVGATLTLLGLIIGFSFSMAIARYDQRKNYEEAEANAIGTEYLRTDLLPAADAANVRALLKSYLEQRILFYKNRNARELRQINAATADLQAQMWSAVRAPAGSQPTPVLALAIAGMNDVLNSQGYTQAAWWNRIPPGAWFLMVTVAICANFLIGYDARHGGTWVTRLLVLPFVLCIAFYSIADIDSARRGVIRVRPQNLESLAQSLERQIGS